MPFWSRRTSDQRLEAWSAFAAEYELTPVDEMRERMREHFALGPGAIAPVYSLQRTGQPQLVLFDQRRDRSGPAGSVTSLRTGVVVRSGHDHVPVSLRASARRHKVLEEIEARRSGGARLALDDAAFDARVSVYARDDALARSVLTPPVRSVLARLLAAADDVEPEATGDTGPIADRPAPVGVAPQVVIGARNLMLLVEPRAPLAFAPLALLMTDMLTLYAAFDAAVRWSGGSGEESAESR